MGTITNRSATSAPQIVAWIYQNLARATDVSETWLGPHSNLHKLLLDNGWVSQAE